ncbi:hypothetical protein E3N88_10027 [Mikania micrantha]|uniref:Uncharacterized protein n=1 Tax=Mikania micrantha TaxID=192012 RepID=A0A5N6PC52_9ASTR|nr:hypothetical protein E3N88_10027 [Mikania micrantha]
MSTEGTVVSSIPTTPSPITMITFPSSLKLTSTNYLSWKTQIEAFLQGLDLYKFIDGSHLAPLPTKNADGTTTPHATYTAWYRQDRLLYGALVGSLSAPIVSLITNANSSFEAWKILSNTYASPSRGHIKQLQHRLKHTTKTANQNITDYMQSIKVIVDELSILGKTMDTEDVTDIILTGLDQKQYKPVIEAIHARDNPIHFHELHEKLINHELSIAQQSTQSPIIHQPITAFPAHTRNHSKPWNNRSPNPYPDKTAIAYLFQALTEDRVLQVANCKSAKEVWDALKIRHVGVDMVQKARLQTLKNKTEIEDDEGEKH